MSREGSLRPLAGAVAVVAGATRGAGRGIARAFGEAGATVYCTGRSMRGRPSPYNRPRLGSARHRSLDARANGAAVQLMASGTRAGVSRTSMADAPTGESSRSLYCRSMRPYTWPVML